MLPQPDSRLYVLSDIVDSINFILEYALIKIRKVLAEYDSNTHVHHVDYQIHSCLVQDCEHYAEVITDVLQRLISSTRPFARLAIWLTWELCSM